MLSAGNVSVSFSGKEVVGGFSLDVKKGGKVAVIGPNGSGKSTLALLICGAIPEYIDADVKGRLSAGKTGIVLQNPSSQFLSMTVKEELSHCRNRGKAAGLLGRSVFQLSEGEKQKVNLLANLEDCELLVLDEPLELLDPKEAKAFLDGINSVRGKTVIWFDKDTRFTKGWKTVRLKGGGKQPYVKKKGLCRRPALGKIALDASFSVERKGFRTGKFTLELKEGEKAALIGPNGAGKTTLLRALAGIEKCGGEISARLPFSYAPQNPSHLLFRDRVREEIPCEANIGALGLSEIAEHCPSKLSKGQQKLVSVASIAEGSIALLDEPTTWLDRENRERVYSFIRKAEQPMVIATHDPEIAKLCGKVFLVENREVKQCSSTMARDFFQGRAKA